MGTKHRTPEFLYKYRSLANRDYIEQIIIDWRIYYPKPAQINDPFDCRMPCIQSYGPWWARAWMAAQKATTDTERIEVASRYEPKLYRSAEEREQLNKALTPDEEREFKELLSSVIKPILEKSGVLSLSAINNNVVMWSHYANSHKGICLKFCLDEWASLNILPVSYPKERLLLKLDYESFKAEQVLQALVLTKDPSWAYEYEWRSLAPTSDNHPFPEAALVGIILGCEIDADDEKWLRGILPSGGRVKLYRAEKREKEFGLDIREL